MGTKFLPASDQPGGPGPVCLEARTLGKGFKPRGVLPSPAPEPGDGPAPSALSQPQALHSLWGAHSLWGVLPQPWPSWRLWCAQLMGLLTLQVYMCQPLTSICSSSRKGLLGVGIDSPPRYQV